MKRSASVFIFQWLIVNAIGWSFYSFIILNPSILAKIGMGCLLGLLQWIVLRKFIGIDFNWFWASFFVYGVYVLNLETALGFFVIEHSYVKWLIYNIFFLGVMGFIQRSILDYFVHQSILWVFVSPFAGFFGVFLAIYIVSFIGVNPYEFWLAFGLFYGFVTGMAMIYLWETVNLATLAQTSS